MWILYTMDNCPACSVVKSKAMAAGIIHQIDVRNIDRSPGARDELRRLGARVVPVLVDPHGGVHINHEAALRALGL